METSYQQAIYAPRLEAGQEYQDHVAMQLLREGIPLVNFQSRRWQRDYGENALGLEIKFDRRFRETGNLYIETHEKSDPSKHGYSPSGIYRLDNSWLYGVGDYMGLYVFAKRRLITIHESRRFKEKENDSRTSKGFLIPREAAAELADRIFGPWEDEGR